VSAKVRDGIEELRDDLVQLLPEGPALFPREQRTDLTLEDRVAEVIREKALHLTRDEVPHALMVEVDELGDTVRARVLVETESQKGILIGKRGAMIREIGTRARPEVEALVGHRVFLELVVKAAVAPGSEIARAARPLSAAPQWKRCTSGVIRRITRSDVMLDSS
jgi:GTP-binding protein Era